MKIFCFTKLDIYFNFSSVLSELFEQKVISLLKVLFILIFQVFLNLTASLA